MTYPNVPLAPGVPPVARGFSQVVSAIDQAALLAADASLVLQSFLPSPWGIYNQDGSPALLVDTVLAVAKRVEERVADFQIENGGFASYDKVDMPFDARVRMAVAGMVSDRADFLATLETMRLGLTLYDVATPEETLQSCNVVHYDYERTQAGGATLLVVDVWLREIRIIEGQQFTQTQAPDGADAQNGGVVQTVGPDSSQTQAGTAFA